MPFVNNPCKSCTTGRFPVFKHETDNSCKGACYSTVNTHPYTSHYSSHYTHPCVNPCTNTHINPWTNVHTNPWANVHTSPCTKPCINPCVTSWATPHTNPCSFVAPCHDYKTKEVVIKDYKEESISKQVCGGNGKSHRSLSFNA